MKTSNSEALVGFGIVLAWIVAVLILGYGWVLNILALLDATTAGEIVARVIGVVFTPLGAFLGYFW